MKKIIISFFSIICFFSACDKEPYTTVPNTRNLHFKFNLVLDEELIPQISGVKTFTVPRVGTDILSPAGIVVINGIGKNLDFNLYAYDLACPVDAKNDSLVRIVPNNVGQATCPHCKAVFSLSHGYGNPLSGSKYPLRSYSVIPNGNMQYIVRN